MDFSSAAHFNLRTTDDDSTRGTSYESQFHTVAESRKPPKIGESTASLPLSLLENWTRLHASGFTSKFYTRLLRLASGRYSGQGLSLAPSSLHDFLQFWELVKGSAVEPDITVSRDGSIYAEWFKSPDQRLDLKFKAPTVFFGLLDNERILEGADTKELIAIILKNHPSNPLQWPN